MLRNRSISRDEAATPPAPETGTTETTTPATNTETAGSPDSGAAPASAPAAESSGKKSNTEILKAERDRIIGLSYKFGGKDTSINVSTTTTKINGAEKSFVNRNISNAEIVDIVNDYPWILDNTIAKGEEYVFSSHVKGGDAAATKAAYNKKSKIPVCYISERKSVVNASIANILSLISTINDIGQTLTTIGNSTSGIMSDVASGAGSMITTFKQKVSAAIQDYLPGFSALLAQNNLNDEILNPYRFLYITADTGKRYVFPMTSKESACFMTSKNAWGEPKGGVPKGLKAIFDTVNSFQTEIAGYTNLGKNIFSLGGTGESADDNGTVKETAKTFTYPTKGDAINIQFTLYNTTRKNAWRDNFRFLYLFSVRNLPFRTEMMSFTPPLLYDIIVPGIKRLPVCALTQMKVDPLGITRTLECDNFISGSGKIPVNVPEAWSIQLTFECLIAPSANLMLANTIGELNIEVASDLTNKFTENEKADKMTELQEQAKKLNEMCKNREMSKRFDAAVKDMKKAQLAGYSIRCKDHMQKNLMALVDEKRMNKHNNGAYTWDTGNVSPPYPYVTDQYGVIKQPFEINPEMFVKLAETDNYTKAVLQANGLSASEMKDGVKIQAALEPYMGKLGTVNFKGGESSKYNIYNNDGSYEYDWGWTVNSNLSWGGAASSYEMGKMTEKEQEIMMKSLEASGNSEFAHLWENQVLETIKAYPDAYPGLKDGEFMYKAAYANGDEKPDGYLSDEKDDSGKSERDKIQDEIDRYNADVAASAKLGLDTSKLEPVCQDTSQAPAEQPAK